MTDLISPWQPEPDPKRRKLIGKMVEECGELTQAAARCLVQGVDENHPVTDKANRTWLTEEVADVLTTVWMVIDLLGLDQTLIDTRARRKKAGFEKWLNDM